jgi:5-methylcytosine-specific restriction enzyme A
MAFGGYEVGRTYNRRRDIHGRFGGQRQGGICTPKDSPVVIAFTGASGRQHGYADGWAAEYRYFGEGQSGDMSWKGGNLAIRDHAASGEDLLLFQTLGDGNVRFLMFNACYAALENSRVSKSYRPAFWSVAVLTQVCTWPVAVAYLV